MVLKLKNLKLENGIYKIRRRVPARLVNELQKKEIIISLKTREADKAQQLYHVKMSEIDNLFTDAERRLLARKDNKENVETIGVESTLSDAAFDNLLEQGLVYTFFLYQDKPNTDYQKYYQSLVAQGLPQVAQQLDYKDWILKAENRYKSEYLREKDVDTVTPETMSLIKSIFGEDKILSKSQLKKAIENLSWAKYDGMQYFYHIKFRGKVKYSPWLPLLEKALTYYPSIESLALDRLPQKSLVIPERTSFETTINEESNSVSAKTLRYCFEQYKSSSKAQTISKELLHIEYFLDFVGRDKAIDAVTRADISSWRNELHKFPTRANQMNVFANMSFNEIIKKNESLKHDTLAILTINKYLTSISKFFSWAGYNCYMEKSNPVLGLFEEKLIKQPRAIYTKEDIDKISENCDKLKDSDVSFYWIVNIAMYSGARQKEICQLLVSDIVKLQGIYCFYITARNSEEKSIKNSHSERYIPIHHTLIENGFLDYVKARKAMHKSKLFDYKLYDKSSKPKSYSQTFGKAYSQFLIEIGIKKAGLTFHSWRHTFISELRRKAVPKRIIGDIVGHREQTVTDQYGIGADFYPLDVWQKHINKVNYSEVL